jgi:hypothetical protein
MRIGEEMNLPEGWPTEEMVKAAFSHLCRGDSEFIRLDIEGAIKAALAVAPTPPAQEDEPVAWMHDKETRVDIAHASVKDLWMKVSPKRVEHYTIPLYARPKEIIMKTPRGFTKETLKGFPKELVEKINKEQTSPAQEDEPKGTPVGASDGCETRVARYYTAADDKLRRAAESLVALSDRWGTQMPYGIKVGIEELRAALERK